MAGKHTYEVRPATLEDAAEIAPRLRQADLDEAYAMTGNKIGYALAQSVRRADGVWIGLCDGEPICIFGVNPVSMVDGSGSPWLVGTPKLEQHAKAFLRYSNTVLSAMKTRYRYLENYVDARNDKSIRWLKWLGFRVEEAKPFGPFMVDFHKFYWRAS